MTKGPVTALEAELAARLLRLAAETFSNHGCNDFELENTDANWAYLKGLYDEEDPDNNYQRSPVGKPLYVDDSFLMQRLADRLDDVENDEEE